MKPLSLRVEEAAQEANAVLLSALAAGATWFAPLPEAVMTAQAIQQIFGLPVGIAACVAASLELIGVSANAALNDVREFNAEAWIGANGKRLQNPRHPLEDERRPRRLLVAFYATTAGIVWATAAYNVFVEGAPLIRLLACLFPIASGVGAMVANGRASLRRKVAGLAVEEASEKQAKGKPAQAPQVETQAPQVETQVEESHLHDYASMTTVEAIKTFYGENPLATQASAAQAVGVTRQAVGQSLAKLEQAGQVRRNGHGVEIIN
jgi:hypothetical protein